MIAIRKEYMCLLKAIENGMYVVITYVTKLMTICVIKLIFKVFQSVLPPVEMLDTEDHKESCLKNGSLVTLGRIFDRKRNSIRPIGINTGTIYREKCQSNPSSG